MVLLSEHAPAKVNLLLHVLSRRADGYHTLESLAAFADIGDVLDVRGADRVSLAIEGPFAAALAVQVSGRPNLVLEAASRIAPDFPAEFRLRKNLPVAGGLGGGSADAAAALRALCRLAPPRPVDAGLLAIAREIGADVPVCLVSRAAWMEGAGERVVPLEEFPRLPALLVNPGRAVETRTVFAALGMSVGDVRTAPLPARPLGFRSIEDVVAFLRTTRNDLESVAVLLEPAIGDVLDLLHGLPGARLARMSGSGATCFALFGSKEEAQSAADSVRRARPGWWCAPASLG